MKCPALDRRPNSRLIGDCHGHGRRLGWMCGVALLLMIASAGCSGIPTRTDNAPVTHKEKTCAAVRCRWANMPKRIILNLTTAPATSQAVTWRTCHPVARPQAQIVPASGSVSFDDGARSVDARSETVTLADGRTVVHHAVVFEGLAPDTVYAYRVGTDEAWSEWNQFKTANDKPAPFSFIYFGDPQEEIRSKCSRVFRTAYRKAPDAVFWHFVGDLVDNGDQDGEWGELFAAMGWIPRTTPMIMLPGNHEYPSRRTVKEADYHLFPLWRPQFTLPENGPAGLEETVYSIDYQGVRLVMLNGNERLEDQARWLEDVLSDHPQPWTIAAIHQPIYSTGKYRNQTHLQDLFVPIFDKYRVDLVLQGHDHTYGRSAKLKNGVRDETGTVYVVSVSGPKSYPLNPRYRDLMDASGTGKQLFQVIRVTPARLTYESVDAAGTRYDAFALEKASPGKIAADD
jgi:acid phosphatase type 7